LGARFAAEINQITQDIYQFAGEQFNINSPKQLAVILFDKLGLPTDKKRSTGADKLEHLSMLHPIIPYLLRYRKISKLQSTYVSGLLPLLDGSHRLHTIFKQALTATGRLSSTEPNLQNIPVRTPEGKSIRTAFVPSDGNKLVVADYSQIELRLMAHFSEDANMVKAYREGQDIHAATAAKVYGVDISEVTPEMRSSCKAVNFGIIYGISDFGLSENIGVSVKEAKRFIERYFELYPGVAQFMHDIVELAKKQGYVTTLSGRKRSIPELSSSVYNVRSFGERAAMNTPLQGTASDIIKIAMIKVYRRLEREGLRAKMILQVHDELVIDTPKEEVDRVCRIVKEEMESVYTLKVPLVASVGVGDNWVEAK
jgi:DNA polymerase-1